MYRVLTSLFPKKIRDHYNKLFIYAGVKINEDKFLGFFLVFSITTAVLIALLLTLLLKRGFFLAIPISFIILHLGFYFTFSLRGDAVGKEVEKVLPDALQLMTSNLRAGLTTDKALLLSTRPEFGPLNDALILVGKKVNLGEDISEAMVQMTYNIKSEKLKKIVFLIISSIKSGGQLTDVLDQTSKNLRQEIFMSEKIRSNVLMYVIFIFVAIGIGAPILFGLSTFLVKVLEKNLASIELPETTILPITFSETNVSSSFVLFFAVISLVTSATLGSIILGMINKGKESAGIKYIPILVILSITVFFLTRIIIGALLGSIFDL